MKASIPIPIAVLALLLSCVGCNRADARDDLSADTASWQMAGEPRLRIGRAEGAAHELDRVYGALLRPDGSVLLGNSGTAELRLYGRDGAHLENVGRMGRGPGEFQSINWMQRFRGDSVIVFDMRAQRFSVWSAAGTFGRVFRPNGGQRSIRPVGVFPDGTLLVAAQNQYDPRRQRGVVRDELALFRIGTEGEVLGEPGRFPGAEWLLYEHPTSFRAAQVPYGRKGHLAVAGSHFVYGSSDSPNLSVHDASGRLVRRIAVPGAARELTAAEIDGQLAAIRETAEREALRRHLQSADGNRAPWFLDLRSDRSGNLWIQLPPAPGGRATKWLVMDLAGRPVGSVMLPAQSLPLDIHADTVLLRETDEDGVQTVAVRSLAR